MEKLGTDQFRKIVSQILENAKADRNEAQCLLDEVHEKIEEKGDYRDLGPTTAKFIEAMQRSNEQLIKLAGIAAKFVKDEHIDEEFEIATDMREEIYKKYSDVAEPINED